jgi:hypothetical protein
MLLAQARRLSKSNNAEIEKTVLEEKVQSKRRT